MRYRNLQHSINIVSRRLHFFWGKRNYISALWWGIKLGKDSKFDGKCHFEKFPDTIIEIGDNCEFRSRKNSNLIGINRPCSISTMNSKYQASVEIGNNCGFSGTVIGAFKSIKIGANVKCGANTLITDADWHLDDIRSGAPKDVIIGDNVWLGEGAKVLKGVTIGENSLIGAGSVVTKSIAANVIAAGNPCKELRSL
ncbi:acyltransferase [Lutimonas halocynthiae]|uniref:acyltransferase n=1 Tax=Lutimonas halocynthiae TaxID=1446477 RepID=UPI0025B2989F|nr:acyltransferase [Lutimonas halocynthiae]MDN3641809.1 acyltransferase [Lutimonas halocynthiae]